jgi:hypothetical protein
VAFCTSRIGEVLLSLTKAKECLAAVARQAHRVWFSLSKVNCYCQLTTSDRRHDTTNAFPGLSRDRPSTAQNTSLILSLIWTTLHVHCNRLSIPSCKEDCSTCLTLQPSVKQAMKNSIGRSMFRTISLRLATLATGRFFFNPLLTLGDYLG